ncbi:MAG TPA: diphthamide biosynthesis enzyme Dph2 [Archaeoglobus profundus]|nr:diphthamide biosynthesis enzyme Dph2 [Archaeoglobus profundus]
MLKWIKFDVAIKKLKDLNAKRIGIQLPNGLKHLSNDISTYFEEKGYEVIISGSGCYGACDIDLDLLKEVDALLHFVHTPIFEFKNVIYVPYVVDYDVNDIRKIINIKGRSIALIASTQYAWKLNEVKKVLEEMGYKVELKKGSKRIKLPGQVLGCDYSVLKDSKAEAILFIGDGMFHPIGAALYSRKKVYMYSPLEKKFEEVKVDNFLKKRMIIVSKAMNGEKGAILVSKKVGQKRLKLALKLKKKAKEMGKHVDILYLDDITPEKLSNFLYDYYVNTACPRISYDDVDIFDTPILTPQEFEILIGSRNWDEYEIDLFFD